MPEMNVKYYLEHFSLVKSEPMTEDHLQDLDC